MRLPAREKIKTNADLIRLLLEDERVIALKNSDLAHLRQLLEAAP